MLRAAHLPTPCSVTIVNLAEAKPSPEDVQNAPLLTNWRPALAPQQVPLLIGSVSNHPDLGSTIIRTSRLIALDADMVWARTVNRWYALGSPASGEIPDYGAKLGVRAMGRMDELERILVDYINLVRGLEPIWREDN